MEKVKISSNSMEEIVKNYIGKKGYELSDSKVFEIIEKMKLLIEEHLELNYLEDIREDVLHLNIKRDYNLNIIIKKDNIDDKKLKKITVKFLEMLDEQGLILILEPNNNIYIDVDYNKLVKLLYKDSFLACMGVINALELIQNNALVTKEGILNYENYKKIHKEILISKEFEEDEIRHKYLDEIISYLKLMAKVYRKK